MLHMVLRIMWVTLILELVMAKDSLLWDARPTWHLGCLSNFFRFPQVPTCWLANRNGKVTCYIGLTITSHAWLITSHASHYTMKATCRVVLKSFIIWNWIFFYCLKLMSRNMQKLITESLVGKEQLEPWSCHGCLSVFYLWCPWLMALWTELSFGEFCSLLLLV